VTAPTLVRTELDMLRTVCGFSSKGGDEGFKGVSFSGLLVV